MKTQKTLIAELKQENKNLRKDIYELSNKRHELQSKIYSKDSIVKDIIVAYAKHGKELNHEWIARKLAESLS